MDNTVVIYLRNTSGGGRPAVQAESWLRQRFEPTRQPTKYIAGFKVGHGREIALERQRHSIQVWVDSLPVGLRGVHVLNRSNPGQPYAASQSRNSNLRAATPTLAEGHPAYCLRVDDLDALEALVRHGV